MIARQFGFLDFRLMKLRTKCRNGSIHGWNRFDLSLDRSIALAFRRSVAGIVPCRVRCHRQDIGQKLEQ